MRPAVTHWLVNATEKNVRCLLESMPELLTVIHEDHPTHHERYDTPAPRDLVEDLRAWKVRTQYGVDVRHSKHEGKRHGERSEEADGHR